jgi:hypothetical protein
MQLRQIKQILKKLNLEKHSILNRYTIMLLKNGTIKKYRLKDLT